MRVSMNNWADTVFDVFIDGVKLFGCPLRVRGDRGGGNIIVAAWMQMIRGILHNVYIWGV